jgi:hypothetical protein
MRPKKPLIGFFPMMSQWKKADKLTFFRPHLNVPLLDTTNFYFLDALQ